MKKFILATMVVLCVLLGYAAPNQPIQQLQTTTNRPGQPFVGTTWSNTAFRGTNNFETVATTGPVDVGSGNHVNLTVWGNSFFGDRIYAYRGLFIDSTNGNDPLIIQWGDSANGSPYTWAMRYQFGPFSYYITTNGDASFNNITNAANFLTSAGALSGSLAGLQTNQAVSAAQAATIAAAALGGSVNISYVVQTNDFLIGQNYTNNTGLPVFISESFTLGEVNSRVDLLCYGTNGVFVNSPSARTNGAATLSATIVPNGHWQYVTNGSGAVSRIGNSSIYMAIGSSSSAIGVPTTTVCTTTNISYPFRGVIGDFLIVTNLANKSTITLSSNAVGSVIVRFKTDTDFIIVPPTNLTTNWLAGSFNTIATNGARLWITSAGTNFAGAVLDLFLKEP